MKWPWQQTSESAQRGDVAQPGVAQPGDVAQPGVEAPVGHVARPGGGPVEPPGIGSGEEIDVETIRAALHDVLDPEVGMSIVDLGLVYAIEANGHRLHVTMTMTSPACPVGESMREQVRERALAASPEGTEVEVDLVTDPPWEPSRMSEAARIRFGWNRR